MLGRLQQRLYHTVPRLRQCGRSHAMGNGERTTGGTVHHPCDPVQRSYPTGRPVLDHTYTQTEERTMKRRLRLVNDTNRPNGIAPTYAQVNAYGIQVVGLPHVNDRTYDEWFVVAMPSHYVGGVVMLWWINHYSKTILPYVDCGVVNDPRPYNYRPGV